MAMKAGQTFPPLKDETREYVTTDCAAFHTNRKPRTLRDLWAAGNGPIQPVRINGRLAWSVNSLKQLLGVTHDAAH